MAAGQGSEPLIPPPRELATLGPMSASLGRAPTGESLRLAAKRAAEEAAQEVTRGDPAQIDALAAAVDAAVKSVDPSLSMGSLQGARRRLKGGQDPPGKRQKGLDGQALAAPASEASKLEYLKSVAAKIVEYAKVELAPISPATSSAVRGVLGLTQEVVIRVPVTLITLSISGTALSVNFFKSLFAKFNAWGRATASEIQSTDYADKAASAATKDLESIAKTTAVAAFFFNQLGLLPLEVVLAAMLYGLQVNLGTGPGRSLLVSQFYTWYIQKPKLAREARKGEISQEEIMKAAKEYTIAIASTSKKVASSAAAAASSAASSSTAAAASEQVKSAATTLAAKLKGFLPSSTTPAAEVQTTLETALKNGEPAAAVVLVTENATNPDDLKDETGEVQPPKRFTLGRRKLGPPSSSSASSSESSSPVATEPPVTRRSTRGVKRGIDDLESPGKKTRGGKRRTKRKAQLKRRATRRVVPSGQFAY